MALKLNENTWYSRLAALVVFLIAMPILAFYIGRQYESTIMVLYPPNLGIDSQNR